MRRGPGRTTRWWISGLLGLAVLLSGCTASPAPGTASSASPSTTPVESLSGSPEATAVPPAPIPATTPPNESGNPAAGTASAALDTLRVAGRGPRTGYERSAFGPRWADTDRNGCDTRNDILRRDLTDVVFRPGTAGCVVVQGVLDDPYTGSAIVFRRGGRSEIDIDHVVALSNGWVSGAARWTAQRRLLFANDPLNLLAVDASANRQKGDGDAATWLPPNRSFRCSYVARQIAVKQKYELSITPAEKAAMQRVLAVCPNQSLPSGT